MSYPTLMWTPLITKNKAILDLLLSEANRIRTPTGRSWHGLFRSWSFDLYWWGQGCRMEEALRMCRDATLRDITSLRIVTTKKLTSVQFFPNGLPARLVHVNLLVWELITDLWSYMLNNTLLYPRRHKNLCISVVLPIDLPVKWFKISTKIVLWHFLKHEYVLDYCLILCVWR